MVVTNQNTNNDRNSNKNNPFDQSKDDGPEIVNYTEVDDAEENTTPKGNDDSGEVSSDLNSSTDDSSVGTDSNDSRDDPDDQPEEGVRPKSFDEIVGREQEKKMLSMMIDAASKRGDVIDHILFYGPPGLGKTTFAVSIANEVGSNLKITSGPAIERQGDLAAILTNLRKGDLLFIDEVHRLNRTVEEVLYPAMEDGVIDIIMGKGPSAKTIRLNLEPFTLIGATTQIGRISSPMRERFGLVQRLDFFSDDDLADIIERAARINNVRISDDALEAIAVRSRGTGRVSLRLFRRIRDYHQSENQKGVDTEITVEEVLSAMELLGIDQYGLDQVDRKLLSIVYHNYNGGPVGLSTLGAAISEDVNTISEVYEPFLLKQGLLQRTARGRVLTQKGLMYVNSMEEDHRS